MSEDNRTVWCGNLSDKVTDELLYELFLQAGPLESVNIPKSKDGKQRNYGFVTFKHECSVPYAVALFEGTALYNRTLHLKSRNGATIDIPSVNFGAKNSMGNERQRTQSLPLNFGNFATAPPAVPDYDMLLQLGQQMFIPGSFGSMPNQVNQIDSFPPTLGLPLYTSQMNSSHYLGGQLTLNPSNWKGSKNRNHPYSRASGSRANDRNHSNNDRNHSGNDRNRSSNGRHSSSNAQKYHRDRGHWGNSGRRN